MGVFSSTITNYSTIQNSEPQIEQVQSSTSVLESPELIYFQNITSEMFTLLEDNPLEYYNKLCKFQNMYDENEIKQIINGCEYRTWYSNHLQALTYVVGELYESPEYSQIEQKAFYGVSTNIDEELGIKILNKLVEYNVDLYNKNYYDQIALEIINNDGISKRINNEKFKKKLYEVYDKKYDN